MDDKLKSDQKAIRECVEEIQKAEFVALDLEFSGLYINNKKTLQLQEYYEHCTDSVRKFLALQLGICCARRQEEDSSHFVLSPFNFHLFPSKRTIFSSDTTCLQWLIGQDFDLHRWIHEGVDYDRLSNVTSPFAQVSESVKVAGAQKIIESIIENQKPVVLHNGFLDLLHIFDKLVCALPASIADFGMECTKLFSGGIWDTKRIASGGREWVFPLIGNHKRATSLDALRLALYRQDSKLVCSINPGCVSKYCLNPPYNLKSGDELTIPNYSAHKPPTKRHRTGDATKRLGVREHEAGYDAMITLHLFLLELEAANDKHAGGPAVALEWANMGLVRKTRDQIELTGVPPGYLALLPPNNKLRARIAKAKDETDRPPTGLEILNAPLFQTVRQKEQTNQNSLTTASED